jgi:hypothetical protein
VRRALVLALLAGGCSGVVDAPKSTTAGDPSPGASGQTPGGGSGGSGGAAGGSSPGSTPPSGSPVPTTPAPQPSAGDSGCGRLVPVSALSFQDLPAAPGARLRVRAELSTGGRPEAPWAWLVTYGEGAGTVVATTPLDAEGSLVELPLEKQGKYSLSATSGACVLRTIAFAVQSDRRLAQFRLRLAPPPGLPFPTQEWAVQALAGTPLTQPLVVQSGAEVVLEPHDASGKGGVSSYVRVTETRSALTVEGHTGGAPFKALLLAAFTYDVLLVPDGDVAPLLQTGKTPAALNVLPLALTPGTALTGQALDGTGKPVRDARVVLRVGALTSTVGASDAGGAFALRVRGGTFGVAVAPPPDSGLPELSLGPDPGLPIPEAASAGSAEIRWATAASAPLSLVVRGPDGVLPAAGARVRVEHEGVLPAAATLTLRPAAGPAVTRALDGLAHAAGEAGADGAVSLPALPTGRYRVTVVPADGSEGALTSATVELGPGGATAVPIRLAAKVVLRGTLSPGDATAGTRVYATPRAIDPPRPVAMAIADQGGAYQLAVDPGREYLVWADPPAGRGLARTLLAAVSSGPSGAEVPARTLPRALAFTSTVSGDRNQGPLPGVVIQAFCEAASPSCLDPTLPLAEAVSGPGGQFTLTLPDPGSF